MSPGSGPRSPRSEEPLLREAEDALRHLGYPKTRAARGPEEGRPAFWVENPRNRRRTIPVYFRPSASEEGIPSIERWFRAPTTEERAGPPSILVVSTDREAEAARGSVPNPDEAATLEVLRILVLRDPQGKAKAPHWHLARVEPREVLRIATGLVVGLYRRAFGGSGSGEIDFGELLTALRDEYRVDVPGSLGVTSSEEALFVLYHLALRDTFAPGNVANNLHSIVANPTGPATRIRWFAG